MTIEKEFERWWNDSFPKENKDDCYKSFIAGRQSILDKKEIFILISDGDFVMKHIPDSFGIAVDNENEAKLFSDISKHRGYCSIKIFRTAKEAMEHRYPEFEFCKCGSIIMENEDGKTCNHKEDKRESAG